MWLKLVGQNHVDGVKYIQIPLKKIIYDFLPHKRTITQTVSQELLINGHKWCFQYSNYIYTGEVKNNQMKTYDYKAWSSKSVVREISLHQGAPLFT